MTPDTLPQKENSILRIVLAAAELLIMTACVVFDWLIPAILVLVTGIVFALIRREKLPIHAPPRHYGRLKFVLLMLGLAVIWSAVQFTLILPIQNHLLHDTRNVSQFAGIQGNLSALLFYLAAGWTIAAIGEELAFRGFFQNRIISLFRNKKAGTVAAVLVTALLFGLIHTEQGIIGIIVTAIDGIFFSIVRYGFRSIWASVLVHGFMNSIGFIAFYFTGPVYGLW
jgi:membrane protease YdiL (CAAX protease family)